MVGAPFALCSSGVELFLILFLCLYTCSAQPAPPLENGWSNPPIQSRLRAYWWWLNGNVTTNSITRDLEEMKAKGFGGAVLIDANGSDQDGNARVPHGPTFFTPAWRDLYKHALREAKRLGLEMSLNIQSGWNLGGPLVTAEDAAKQLVWIDLKVSGTSNLDMALPMPDFRNGFYRDAFVLAYPLKATNTFHRPLQNWAEKALYKTLVPFSAPNSAALFQEFPAQPGEEDTVADKVLDLTSQLTPDGRFHWQVPEGQWQLLRFGFTIGEHARVSTCSEGWNGYALDVLDAGAFQRYWDAIVEPLISDAGDLAGSTLKYLHTDSWEVEPLNWTPSLPEEFRKRRGYDLAPFMPVLAGRIVNNRPESDRFLNDFRKTIGDLAIDHHYRLFRDKAHKHGLQIHPESGGPHAVPIDAQRCLGWDDAPMSEFWAWSWRHRIGDDNRFFVKQPASAAHTYGHNLVLAEGFTTIGPHWQERLCDNLKPSFDKALCEGMNLLVWHAFVCSPVEMGIPGQQYFAGTHLNPNVTWWSRSAPFFSYINRCQWLLQQGHFVADACYYYGDHVPNFTQHKHTDPLRILPGYDYDVITEEALLQRMSVKDGRLVLPDGMSYAALFLPNRQVISLPVLRKLKELVEAGAVVLGPKPLRTEGLEDFPACDSEVTRLAEQLWANCDGNEQKDHAFGNGRVIWGKSARDVLLSQGVDPDFESFPTTEATPELDYVHRVVAAAVSAAVEPGILPGGNAQPYPKGPESLIDRNTADIYFVANRSTTPARVSCLFRVAGKAPELWNPLTGERRFATAYLQRGNRTLVPIDFAPCGSWFVIFRAPAAEHAPATQTNGPEFEPVKTLDATWKVKFDPKWGGPAETNFEKLVSWTDLPEPGIKYYSGTATYTTSFDMPASPSTPDGSLPVPSPSSLSPQRGEGLRERGPLLSGSMEGKRFFLDLGDVRELAEIRLNGKPLGIIWSYPFRVDVTDALQAKGNQLEIDVVNFWPNRIIGDQSLPLQQRLTKTNIRAFTKDSQLMESGLLGPVRILVQQ